ncbi:tetratricopeptide repeat protein [Pseudanabaena sp. ABRG5-3]|uniref:tetratricopeptide repeat protein n=1 Tax=Pseudanabaena sp. ABRG5-3 TaxID=685565 RepID=UPI000DC6FC91|nr:tetratricopeptide repeat protein [Pseudanabaena sp. ABRG5-3]BBC24093.1 tetratricopeptide repeat domain protein [Pseudanabaena sp. ABRG5-3]
MAKSNQKIVVFIVAFLLVGGLAAVTYFLLQPKTDNPALNPKSEIAPTPKSDKDSKAQSLANSGSEKAAKKDYKGAIADWSDAIRLNPEYFLDAYNRESAKKDDHKQAISSPLDDAKAYGDRGLVKYTLKDYQGAIADWNEAIRLKPDFALAYYNRGVAKYTLGDPKGAIADYNEALKIDRNWGIRSAAAAYYNRGLAKSNLKDRQGEKSDLKKAAELFKQQGDLEQYNIVLKEIGKP